MNSLITGIVDLDRMIMDMLDDKDLMNICSINKKYRDKVCNEKYFEIKTRQKFPGSLETRSFEKYRKYTWKGFYFVLIEYVSLLKTEFGHIYSDNDADPIWLYCKYKFHDAIHNISLKKYNKRYDNIIFNKYIKK